MQFRDLLRFTLTHSITLCHFRARYSFLYKIVFWARPDSENLENLLNVCFLLLAEIYQEVLKRQVGSIVQSIKVRSRMSQCS